MVTGFYYHRVHGSGRSARATMTNGGFGMTAHDAHKAGEAEGEQLAWDFDAPDQEAGNTPATGTQGIPVAADEGVRKYAPGSVQWIAALRAVRGLSANA